MKTWTPAMDAVMLERYPSEGATVLSKVLGVSVDAAYHRARKLGCRASKEVQKAAIRRWKDEYDDILRERYATDGREKIAADLGLSRQTVENRAAALGLTKTKEVWTTEFDSIVVSRYPAEGAASIARVLGLSMEAIYRRAQRLGVHYDWKLRPNQPQWTNETVRIAAAVSSDLKCGIYAIRHTESGRMYVGSALDIFSRWKSHLRTLRQGKHHSRALQATFDKHGPLSLVFEVLDECLPEHLYEHEQYFIDLHKPEFNSAPVAGSPRGIKRTPEQRAETSKRMRAFYADPEKRERVRASKSAAIREKWKDPEFREKMTTAWGSRPWDAEEDTYLANLVGHLPLKELAVVFGRTSSAIQNHALFLGLSLRLRTKGAVV